MTERTFSIIKPDATRRNLTGAINAVIEGAGLRIVAQRIASTVRAGDTMARLGGDEFLVMLDREVTREVTDTIGHRIIDALQQGMTVDGRELRIGASIGVAVYPPLEGDIDALMNRADQAMYAAKRAGKGRLHYAQTA